MHKLSRQQAEELKKAFDSHWLAKMNTNCRLPPMEWIHDMINKCTEREFPALMVPTNEGMIRIKEGDSMNGLFILTTSQINQYTEMLLSIRPDEFKAFTQGCQAIVSWLEEQE